MRGIPRTASYGLEIEPAFAGKLLPGLSPGLGQKLAFNAILAGLLLAQRNANNRSRSGSFFGTEWPGGPNLHDLRRRSDLVAVVRFELTTFRL